MYIFELIARALKKKEKSTQIFAPLELQPAENEEDCEHLFLPIDSSNETFACKYCGLVVPREKLKDKNIFKKATKISRF